MAFGSWCKMKINKCQAYTKKKIPCKNDAVNGSHFCHIHEAKFKDFPPVKITAFMCPYCEKPLRRGAKFCKFCKNAFFVCHFCDEPLRKDATSCTFCKENFPSVVSVPDSLHYFRKFFNIRNWITAKDLNLGYRCFITAVFLLLALFAYFISIDLYRMLDSIWK